MSVENIILNISSLITKDKLEYINLLSKEELLSIIDYYNNHKFHRNKIVYYIIDTVNIRLSEITKEERSTKIENIIKDENKLH